MTPFQPPNPLSTPLHEQERCPQFLFKVGIRLNANIEKAGQNIMCALAATISLLLKSRNYFFSSFIHHDTAHDLQAWGRFLINA
jgi:hypothetical protein